MTISELNSIATAWSHPYNCRCALCLWAWTVIGPEFLAEGMWGFGPFTLEEYLAAGGTIPDDATPVVVSADHLQSESF